eukprot:2791669-Pyramimonas_sp.AAC.1
MILYNGYRRPRGKHAPVNVQMFGMKIEILPPYRATRYFGRELQYSTPYAAEVAHRIATALRKLTWDHKLTIRPATPLQRHDHIYYLVRLRSLDVNSRIGKPIPANATTNVS